jgi:hypothetical protein
MEAHPHYRELSRYMAVFVALPIIAHRIAGMLFQLIAG